MDSTKQLAAIGLIGLTAAFAASSSAAQVSVDLTGWQAESYPAVAGFGAGNWTVAAGGGSVFQSVNGQPTFFVSPFQAFNLQLEGQVSCSGAGDDDFWGFALGFSPGESTNPAADYLLIDWKKGSQFFNFGAPSCTVGASAPAGLAVSRVFGIPTADEFWGHDNLDTAPCSTAADGLVELARGTTKGNVGWVNNTVYTFRFSLTATLLQVWVNDVLELSVPGLYTNGGFAFYNFSQQSVTYSAYTTQCVAGWSAYGFGYGGTAGTPSFALSSNPVLGAPFDFVLGGVNPGPAIAYLVYGFSPAITSLGGPILWVEPFDILTFPIAPGTNTLPFVAPSDPAWCGVALYGQFAHDDASSPFGYAFSPGLEVVFGL